MTVFTKVQIIPPAFPVQENRLNKLICIIAPEVALAGKYPVVLG